MPTLPKTKFQPLEISLRLSTAPAGPHFVFGVLPSTTSAAAHRISQNTINKNFLALAFEAQLSKKYLSVSNSVMALEICFITLTLA
jgi:hypothetical protein